MAKEIELKAHVADWSKTLELLRVDEHTKNEEFAEKFDVYFFNPLINEAFRVRQEILKDKNNVVSKKTIYTVKEKVIDGGIERNKETEVEVGFNNFDDSLLFFDGLGFKQTMQKRKRGYSFMYEGFEENLHIELLEVNNLGWFFEIEFVISDSANQDVIENLVGLLYKTLDLFKIPYSNIENKYYSQLLKE